MTRKVSIIFAKLDYAPTNESKRGRTRGLAITGSVTSSTQLPQDCANVGRAQPITAMHQGCIDRVLARFVDNYIRQPRRRITFALAQNLLGSQADNESVRFGHGTLAALPDNHRATLTFRLAQERGGLVENAFSASW